MSIQLSDNYQTLAHTTSKETQIFGSKLLYPLFGLCGESGEILEKMMSTKIDFSWTQFKELMIKEAGDVTWYVAEVCTVLKIDMNTVCLVEGEDNGSLDFLSAASAVVLPVTKLLEKMKKLFRDGEAKITDELIINNPDTIAMITKYLSEVMTNLDTFVKIFLSSTIKEVCEVNIEKLLSRKQRGVISGSGDNR